MSAFSRSLTTAVIIGSLCASAAPGAVKAKPKAPVKPTARKTTPAKAAVQAPAAYGPAIDIASEPLRDEIAHAVERLQLFTTASGKFAPSSAVKPAELSSILAKAAAKYPQVFRTPPALKGTTLTRETAVSAVAQSLVKWDSRQAILLETNAVKDPLRYFFEDNGFKDGKSVTKSAREAYAVLIYDGVIPDTKELLPLKPCTRAYAAALVARAIPSVNGFSGLALDCNGEVLPAAGGIRVKLETQVGKQQFLFPLNGRFPSRTFSQAPGLASINPKIDVIKSRRVGANPLVITAQRVEGNLQTEGAPSIIISEADAAVIAEMAKNSLLLQTWKVGAYNFYRTKAQQQAAQAAQVLNSASL